MSVRFGLQHRGQKGLGIGMHRCRADVRRRADLHDLAAIEHGNPMAQGPHRGKVMRDEHVATP